MRILLAYTCTLNLAGSLQRAFKVQQTQFKNAWDQYEKVIVTDKPNRFPILSCPLIKSDCWRTPSLSLLPSVPKFCVAACRNTAIEYAERAGVDWLILLDADAVVINFPTLFPDSGFGSLNIWRQVAGQPDHDFDLANRNQWHVQGWWLLRRDIFTAHRFCEDFIGYGHEEDDFRDNILGAAGIPLQDTDAAALHLHHPMRITAPQLANGELYRRRRAAVRQATPA